MSQALSRGETINAGLVIDFLADSRKSAREGLPVFHIGGGSGYIWAAMFDDSGKGRLRITAVNPSLLPERSGEQTPQTVASNAPAALHAASTPAAPAPAPDPAQAEKERAAGAQKANAAAQKEPPNGSETLPADTEQVSRSGKTDANPSPQTAEQTPHHYSSIVELLESGRFRTIEERNAAIAEFNSQSAERAAAAAKEREDKAKEQERAEEIKEENEEAAIRDAVPTKGPEFLNDHHSEWRFSETKDPMTDEAIYSVNSIQRNEDGVVAGVTGTCLKNGTIQFLTTITDDDGNPTIDVVARNLEGNPINGAATVRYRLNDNVQTGTLPSSQFNNRFVSLTINGPAVINSEKELSADQQQLGQALLAMLALTGALQAVGGVDFDLVWGAMIEFETNKGNLVVSIPVFHPAIQQLYKKCFTPS